MKVLLLSLSIVSMLPVAAFATQYDCGEGGYCHEIDVTAEDLGRVDDSYCGDLVYKLVADGSCHQFSPCGADEGKSIQSCQ